MRSRPLNIAILTSDGEFTSAVRTDISAAEQTRYGRYPHYMTFIIFYHFWQKCLQHLKRVVFWNVSWEGGSFSSLLLNKLEICFFGNFLANKEHPNSELTQKCAKTLMSNIFRISSGWCDKKLLHGMIPALFTRIVTSPTSFSTFFWSSITSSLEETSHLS